MDPKLDANRRSWDERVGIHSRSAFYDVEGWLAAERMPRDEERAALGEVTGKTLVHLQCHFGMDTLRFARAGASVTGVDFSGAAIAEATVLAERAGLAARSRFVCSDVYDAPAALGGERFDVAYVSLGSLCWLPDVAAWGQVVADVLVPGGLFYLNDVHPLSQTLGDEDGSFVAYSYFEEPDGYPDDFAFTYTDGEPLENRQTYWWNHSVAETLGALASAGLVIDRFEEHDWTAFEQWEWLVRSPEGRWMIPAGPAEDPAVNDGRRPRRLVAIDPAAARCLRQHGSSHTGR